MAKLVNVWRDDDPVDLTRRQMPLIVDENLTVRIFYFINLFPYSFDYEILKIENLSKLT